eukprot:5929399-Prymnesium_polylepis.1
MKKNLQGPTCDTLARPTLLFARCSLRARCVALALALAYGRNIRPRGAPQNLFLGGGRLCNAKWSLCHVSHCVTWPPVLCHSGRQSCVT